MDIADFRPVVKRHQPAEKVNHIGIVDMHKVIITLTHLFNYDFGAALVYPQVSFRFVFVAHIRGHILQVQHHHIVESLMILVNQVIPVYQAAIVMVMTVEAYD